ncbi:MAG: glycoside hydrolase family 130 protein [Chloroflexi bacterium]|nr:glycoside hydrolase family 130 protein [Chloroflexota bacterium]
MFTRHPGNPLLRPPAVRPSRTDLEVIGTFNAGAALYQTETLLLLRVAERPTNTPPGEIWCPYYEAGSLQFHVVRRDDPTYDTRDSRFVQNVQTGDLWLTSISHLRLARSRDGVQFMIGDTPWLLPTTPEEAFGVEDARITAMDGVYYVNYTAVSQYGIATALVATRDFVNIERLGIIFPPANRDVTLFPQKVRGQYVSYHRPMPGMFGRYNIWLATSPDLVRWGDHRRVLEASATGWESGRVGGGAPPILTAQGWLSIYHAADRSDRYALGAFLTPVDEPARVIARSRTPILAPEAPYETRGFFPNVVFTCGAVVQGDTLRLYYGAADETIALAETSLSALLSSLLP